MKYACGVGFLLDYFAFGGGICPCACSGGFFFSYWFISVAPVRGGTYFSLSTKWTSFGAPAAKKSRQKKAAQTANAKRVSSKKRALINARRGPLYRLALALHTGFVRMTGATLDAYQYVPRILWSHLGKHLGIEPPDLGTLRTLYETRERTLFDHQVIAYQALGFVPMAEH
ncbi:DUF4158 domain-containing protein [Paraburkholderia sp. IMGN_8]|uniref:DUF4158 domain-containing protein n=1 Tax=Paraburkholderia sp. IMGN_8 TaxID=3136564 RepID=UPI003100AB33